MKLLTKQSDYAVRALLAIAGGNGTRISSSTIARQEHIPLNFLRLILRTLVQHDMIEAKEGVRGGFTLVRAPGCIKLSEVIALFQGPLAFTECLFRKRVCMHRPTCPLRRRLAKIERTIDEAFSQVTIATLLNDMERGS